MIWASRPVKLTLQRACQYKDVFSGAVHNSMWILSYLLLQIGQTKPHLCSLVSSDTLISSFSINFVLCIARLWLTQLFCYFFRWRQDSALLPLSFSSFAAWFERNCQVNFLFWGEISLIQKKDFGKICDIWVVLLLLRRKIKFLKFVPVMFLNSR